MLMTWGLSVLKNIITTGISQAVQSDLYSDDGSDNDAFRKIMREAFVEAVKKVKKEGNDTLQNNYIQNEFRHYRKVLLDDLVKLESVERKKYIEQDLYAAFKAEILKREEALQHVSMAIVQAAVQNQQKNAQIIEEMHLLMKVADGKIDTLIASNLENAAQSGLSPSSIIESKEDVSIVIPELHSDRHELIADISDKLVTNKSLLLYAGIKEGKTVAAALLSKQLNNYRMVWLDFGHENRLNPEVILKQYNAEEKLLFVLDNVEYEKDTLYEELCSIVANKKSDNWLFVIICYGRLSDMLFTERVIPHEYALPALSLEEVGDMIPVEKRTTYQAFIFSLFDGQPLLTHMACSYLHEHEWSTSPEEMGNLFTFPKGTSTEKKVKRLARQMMSEENYALVNRLLLLDRVFSIEECVDLAAVNPIIANPRQKLASLCGTWIKEENGKYTLSPLLRRTMDTDLLPQELIDCCGLIARRIICKPGGITPTDALKALNMLITSKNDDDAVAFYTLMLMKLDELKMLEHEASELWKLIWVDVKLPEWMSTENKALVRDIQLIILVMKYHIDGQYIVDDLEKLVLQDLV